MGFVRGVLSQVLVILNSPNSGFTSTQTLLHSEWQDKVLKSLRRDHLFKSFVNIISINVCVDKFDIRTKMQVSDRYHKQ